MMKCSPDERHYTELKRHGSILYYMPTWTLDELLLLGKYLRTCNAHNLEVDFSETDGNTAIVSLLPPIDHVSTLEVGKCFEGLLS